MTESKKTIGGEYRILREFCGAMGDILDKYPMTDLL
jgi:hypothetical protein